LGESGGFTWKGFLSLGKLKKLRPSSYLSGGRRSRGKATVLGGRKNKKGNRIEWEVALYCTYTWIKHTWTPKKIDLRKTDTKKKINPEKNLPGGRTEDRMESSHRRKFKTFKGRIGGDLTRKE